MASSLTSKSHPTQDENEVRGSTEAAQVDQSSGAGNDGAGAPTKPGQLVHIDSAQEEQIARQIVRNSKLPLLAWIICLPGWLWAFSIIPALLQLLTNVAPGHAIPLTTLVSDWNANRTIGSDLRLLTDVNPDTGGLGIRIGFYIPFVLAFLTLVAGLFHKEDSAAEEIGSALLLTLFYLNFNAVKAAAPRYQQLTFPEVVLVCISLDLAGATLHMTNSAKDTLAARKFIFASALNQLVAYGNMIAMLARIRHNYKGLDCTFLVWWSRIDSCTGPSGPVWMYIAIRGLILLHGIWLDRCHTFSFDSIEEDWSELAPADQDNDDDKGEISKYPYASLPGMVFSGWVDWLPSTVVAISSLEVIVARLPPDAIVTDWGQSAALVLAIPGAIHWLYVLIWQVGNKLWKGRETHELNFPRYHKDWNPSITGTDDDLIRASKAGDMKKIRRALKHGAKINHVDPNGRMTALLYAVQRDNVDLVQELMSKNNNGSPSIPHTRPALLFAVENGSDKVLSFLTDTKKLSLSELDDDRDAIWFAAQYGRLHTIKLLLAAWKKKSSTDGIRNALKLADERREPALVVAVQAQHKDVVEYLVKQLRDANLTVSYAKALAKATKLRDETVLKALLTYDSDPEAIRAQLCQWPVLQNAIAARRAVEVSMFLANAYYKILGTIDVFDAEGRTPLALAAIHNDLGTTELLLVFGADPFAKRQGDTTDQNTPFLLEYKETSRLKAEFPSSPHYRRAPRSPCRKMICDVRDGQAFLLKLLTLSEDILAWLVNFNFLDLETRVGKADLPLLFYALKAPTTTPFKCLLRHPDALRDSSFALFTGIINDWVRQNRARGITTSRDELCAEIAGYWDAQLSRMPADVLEMREGKLGSSGAWDEYEPEIAEVFRKYSCFTGR